jgi:hypothetical protein
MLSASLSGSLRPVTRLTYPLIVLLAGAMLLVACGEDEQSEAKTQFCDAAQDLQKQVEEVRSFNLATLSLDKLKQTREAIEADVDEIASAADDLEAGVRSDLQDAASQFEEDVKKAARSGASVAQIYIELNNAVEVLDTKVRAAFSKLECS